MRCLAFPETEAKAGSQEGALRHTFLEVNQLYTMSCLKSSAALSANIMAYLVLLSFSVMGRKGGWHIS
jgi:hypothetical protein